MGAKTKNKNADDSSSPSGSEDEQDGTYQTSISKLHNELFKNARKERLGWVAKILSPTAAATADDLAAKVNFDTEYKSRLRGGLKNDTAVHSLVKLMVPKRWRDAICFRPVLEYILQIDPEILEAPNDDLQFAFLEAVRERKLSLAEVGPYVYFSMNHTLPPTNL